MVKRTLIIAEAGVNHNGDLMLAKKLIASAAVAGADIVKFQSFVTTKLVSSSAPKANYQNATTNPSESQFEMVRKLELTKEDHLVLLETCQQHGIQFLSTAFDPESFDMLIELGIDWVKIPSGEITNLPFLRHVARTGKPVLLSTGMATLGEIEAALDVIEQAGTPRDKVTVLHCSTEYPTPMAEVNLRAMCNMGHAFGVEVGYSDHTVGIEVPVAAVALGATVIEKHFTTDRNLPGPDHQASLEPHELKAMVDAIRNIEQALGDGIKRPNPSEIKNKGIARKSLIAARAIRAGERFTADNLTAKRPGTGISPMRWDEVLGRVAHRDFAPDELIDL
ncbi:N-acetylneuraminate synthase [Geothrix oryzae]|uniref:N-acetylneuraminate synthase n=1 Tax=Geothrix oryzae TaxID=2927975 RepID=A0ABN6UZF7_9BACT|nr:N-acetylneuraminate synthase [Geothrix oryzae]BDU70458.1 N-acetylneuraminate synthase [Geothrix oryzae]